MWTAVFGTKIVVTPNFLHSPPNSKLLTLIHEGSHLALETEDTAYRWESSGTGLRGARALNNADSVAFYLFAILGKLEEVDTNDVWEGVRVPEDGVFRCGV